MYNWQQTDWPHFTYSLETLQRDLLLFVEKMGRVSGAIEALSDESHQDITIQFILEEAIKTSAIEGEFPHRNDVLSSIRKNLGIHETTEYIKDKSALGLGELMIDIRNSFKDPLTKEKLFAWHVLLMGASDQIEAGKWRTHEDPMVVVSGPIHRRTVHFEAPPSNLVPTMMDEFINWFNQTAPNGRRPIFNPIERAAVAHLYFESIHPFEDGNGRIGRALAEKAITQTLGRPVLLSLSSAIEANKKQYYQALESAQRSNEITEWIEYFVRTALQAQEQAENYVLFTVQVARYFDKFSNQLNDRQKAVVRRMTDEGPAGFVGGMNAKKYMTIAKTSKATATRDLQEMLDLGAFVIGNKGGRSTTYYLPFSQ